MGLAIHNVKSPAKKPPADRTTTQVTKREVEENQIDDKITLRRTTIEEVEMKPGADTDKLNRYEERKER